METKNILEIAKEWEEGKRYIAVGDIITELELLSSERLTDKKRHDVIHWLHIRKLITRLNDKE
jgi:hypothetical protein